MVAVLVGSARATWQSGGLLPGSGSGHAMVLDVDTFVGLPASTSQPVRPQLAEHGWSVVLVRAGTTVPNAWAQLHRAAEVLG